MKILHIFDDYGTPGERALAGGGSVPTVVYYLSPGYVPVALRQVLRQHGLDEMGFIPKVNVNQDTILRIISGGGKLFLVEEYIH